VDFSNYDESFQIISCQFLRLHLILVSLFWNFVGQDEVLIDFIPLKSAAPRSNLTSTALQEWELQAFNLSGYEHLRLLDHLN